MGQKCSCLFNKEGETNTVFFPPQTGDSEPSYIVNEKYSKLANQKLDDQDAKSRSLNKVHSVTNMGPTDEKDNSAAISLVHRKLIAFQSLVRSVIYRKKFNAYEKRERQETINKLLEEYKTKFTNVNLQKTEGKYPTFDRLGWKKFYKEGEDRNESYLKSLGVSSLLVVDYGKVFDVKFLKDKHDECFYTGTVNIDNKRHGYGELTYENGSKYQGHWLNGNFMGWGRFIDAQGNFNEGIKYL